MSSTRKADPQGVVRQHVAPGSAVYTYAFRSYNGLSSDYPEAGWERAMTVQEVMLKAPVVFLDYLREAEIRAKCPQPQFSDSHQVEYSGCIRSNRQTIPGLPNIFIGARKTSRHLDSKQAVTINKLAEFVRHEYVGQLVEIVAAFSTATTGLSLKSGQITCQTEAHRSLVKTASRD